jgi:sec-independent protein translocase protein TatA
MPLLIFEFLGTTELIVILVVALVLFGPRKLPQLSRQLGKSLSEFRRASDDFRNTWENEVKKEMSLFDDNETDRAMLPPEDTTPARANTIGRGQMAPEVVTAETASTVPEYAESVEPSHASEPIPPLPEPSRKRDWL